MRKIRPTRIRCAARSYSATTPSTLAGTTHAGAIHTGSGDTRAAGATANARGAERGDMLIFGLGVWAAGMVLALVLAAASQLYIERRDLCAEADYLALALADDVALSLYYEEGIATFDDGELYMRAQAYAREGTQVIAAYSEGESVLISLQRSAAPFIAIGEYGQVDVHASARAELRAR